MTPRPPVPTVAAVLLGLLWTAPAVAADHFLVIGGGYAPSGNQVSLEKNVRLFRTLLGETYPSGVDCDVYFSDGDDPGRDVQYVEPPDALPRVNLLLARVYRQTDALGERYRTHGLDEVRGGSNAENLRRWFRSTGQTFHAGDRLLIYATAHGGKGTKEEPENTALYLWNHESIRVAELRELIATLPTGVEVVLVMVQCYSGGFAGLAIPEENGPAATNVCGFFATTHDRPAAGCTPDIDEENYHEYSSYFWEALRGRTRTDQPISRDPDLDGDGLVSFAEAHAYAMLESVTVDIMVKTSDAFLRRYSRADAGAASPLLTASSPIDTLLTVASTADRAVVLGLSDELGLDATDRLAAARSRAEGTESEKKRLDGERRRVQRRLDGAAGRIRARLESRWPELKNRWNPEVTALLTTEAPAVVALIESHPSFGEFEEQRRQLDDLDERRLDQDRIWVKCQRLIRTLESIALEANLPAVADAATVGRYRALVDLESGGLGAGPAAHARVAPAGG